MNKRSLKEIASKIIQLKEEDLVLRNQLIQKRQLGEGYNEEMAKLHDRNAKQLDEIMDNIGYPTIEKVGKEASEAAWLIVQHAIGQPHFMRKCLKLLANAVTANQASPISLAYLTDRIATFEGRPQLYGTSYDWDEQGALSPTLFDDLDKVNQRRKAIGLNSMEEQLQIIRRQAKIEHQSPPKDWKERSRRYEEWRKAVGWIK